jgi:hypothetical protein
VEPEWWSFKNKGEDDADEDSPSNDYTLNQASLQLLVSVEIIFDKRIGVHTQRIPG